MRRLDLSTNWLVGIPLGGSKQEEKKKHLTLNDLTPQKYTFSIIHTYRSAFATLNINNLAPWVWQSQHFPATIYMLNVKATVYVGKILKREKHAGTYRIKSNHWLTEPLLGGWVNILSWVAGGYRMTVEHLRIDWMTKTQPKPLLNAFKHSPTNVKSQHSQPLSNGLCY